MANDKRSPSLAGGLLRSLPRPRNDGVAAPDHDEFLPNQPKLMTVISIQ
jgi:hypothetical protein